MDKEEAPLRDLINTKYQDFVPQNEYISPIPEPSQYIPPPSPEYMRWLVENHGDMLEERS